MRKLATPLLFLMMVGSTALLTGAAELRVAAASDLAFVLPEIAAGFEKQSGATVKVSFGSSGNFAAQMQNGAPFDVFMAADIGYPKKIIEAGVADATSLYVYGSGKIVIWAPKSSELDLEGSGMRVLLEKPVTRIAIANPQHAPYGRAAVAALSSFGIYEAVKPKLVLGENISQAAQFVQSGNAEVGILALSLALAPTLRDKGKYWLVPPDSYPALEQAAVALKNSNEPQLAQAFIKYLSSPSVIESLRRYGFEVRKALSIAR